MLNIKPCNLTTTPGSGKEKTNVYLEEEESGSPTVPGGDVVGLSGDVDLLTGDVASSGDPGSQRDGPRHAAEATQVLGLAAAR